ncbi:MAG: hypothetical protein ACI8UD_002032, partial [Planctomycetota bacterium]
HHQLANHRRPAPTVVGKDAIEQRRVLDLNPADLTRSPCPVRLR